MSVGVAGVGAIFFALVGSGGVRKFLAAGESTALVTAALLVVAFVLAFRLPPRARAMAPEADPAPATADAAAATATLDAVPAICRGACKDHPTGRRTACVCHPVGYPLP